MSLPGSDRRNTFRSPAELLTSITVSPSPATSTPSLPPSRCVRTSSDGPDGLWLTQGVGELGHFGTTAACEM